MKMLLYKIEKRWLNRKEIVINADYVQFIEEDIRLEHKCFNFWLVGREIPVVLSELEYNDYFTALEQEQKHQHPGDLLITSFSSDDKSFLDTGEKPTPPPGFTLKEGDQPSQRKYIIKDDNKQPIVHICG